MANFFSTWKNFSEPSTSLQKTVWHNIFTNQKTFPWRPQKFSEGGGTTKKHLLIFDGRFLN